MINWEYAILMQDDSSDEADVKSLDAQGMDGWELVSVVHDERLGANRFYFKRPSYRNVGKIRIGETL